MYDYRKKLKGQDGRNSIYDILSLSTFDDWDIIKTEYEATDISTVKINGNTFSNYGQYQFIWEKSFVKSPERSSSGNIGNLNSYATFLTPHLIMDFSVMSIDDYRQIMLLHYSANEFTVECYDPIYNRKIKAKMYFGTEEMAKLYTINKMRLNDQNEWEEWIELVGVTEYKVELIGTNNDLDLVSVRYVYNAPVDDNGSPIYPNGVPVPDQYGDDIYLGEEIVVGENCDFINNPPNNQWRFSKWAVKDKDGNIYQYITNGIPFTVNEPLTLYAVWKPITSYTLSFNYGLSEVATQVDSNTGILTEILNREITNTNNIGVLPPITSNPTVEYNDGKKYPIYYNGAWYKTPNKTQKVSNYDAYWTTRDTIIYALYDEVDLTVSYVTNNPNIYIPVQTTHYGNKVYLPTLSQIGGYIFEGWYLDAGFNQKFDGTMPPYSITLYARWVLE
jgi:uncharacterized repeat protein (TIGR02543 family)